MKPKIILAICGSTRKESSNHQLIRAIAKLFPDDLDFKVYTRLADIPAFNPDIVEANQPPEVTRFRQLIRDSDGVLFCTPEYAHGVPGALKNAIDWTVGTSDFSGKPTALITAATDGRAAHASLLDTLKMVEAKEVAKNQLLIQFVKTKLNTEEEIIHEPTRADISAIITSLKQIL